jgi:hypothetical protein
MAMNEVLLCARVACVFVHVLALAVALGAILREDWRMLFARKPRLHLKHLHQLSRMIVWALAALWVSGLSLIAIDTGFDPDKLITSPKLVAKLIVVITLTLNGIVLHNMLLPALSTPASRSENVAALFAVVGAVSMVSWLYAALLGIANPLTPLLGYGGFMGIYIGLLAIAIGVALTVMRPRVERLLGTTHDAESPDSLYTYFGPVVDVREL